MTAILLLLALQSSPLDRAEALLEQELFEPALRAIEEADRADPRWAPARDRAVQGMARDLQRAEGYDAALRFLEERLESRAIIDCYTETCIWAGEEPRGLDRVRRLDPALAHAGSYAEFQLLWARLDFAAIERRAREVDWPEWEQWAREQQAKRDRFASRAARAWWVALGAAALLAGGCAILFRLAGRRPAAA